MALTLNWDLSLSLQSNQLVASQQSNASVFSTVTLLPISTIPNITHLFRAYTICTYRLIRLLSLSGNSHFVLVTSGPAEAKEGIIFISLARKKFCHQHSTQQNDSKKTLGKIHLVGDDFIKVLVRFPLWWNTTFLVMRTQHILYFYTLDLFFVNKWTHHFRHGDFLLLQAKDKHKGIISSYTTLDFRKKIYITKWNTYSKNCNACGQNTIHTCCKMKLKHANQLLFKIGYLH